MKTKEEIIEPFIWKDNSGNPRIAIMDCLNAMEIYADQFKQSHIQVVMQAEGSDGVQGAAVGKEREEKGVSDGFKKCIYGYPIKCKCKDECTYMMMTCA